MLVNIAGTSGSGKSTLMRSFLDWSRKHGIVEDGYFFNEEKPCGYSIEIEGLKSIVFVVGLYNTPTGGCDTIHDVSELFYKIKTLHEEGCHVLYEGLFVMNMTRGPQLATEVGRDLCILQLTTPLATCMASINARRAEKGKGALENKENTVGNYKRATNYCAVMRDAGARVFRVSRDEGLDKILELLGLSIRRSQ